MPGSQPLSPENIAFQKELWRRMDHNSRAPDGLPTDDINSRVAYLTDWAKMPGLNPNSAGRILGMAEVYAELGEEYGAATTTEAHQSLADGEVDEDTVSEWIGEGWLVSTELSASVAEGYPRYGEFLNVARRAHVGRILARLS